MRLPLPILGLLILGILGVNACGDAPGQPPAGDPPMVPNEVSDFKVLFAANCSGCHGTDGKGGAAIALANPEYLAIVDDGTLRRVASTGIRGTSMPAFAQSAGGMLTEKQIDVMVRGIRGWSKPDALQGSTPPPYSSTESGDASRGSKVYATYCQSCHGIGGLGGQRASSVVDGSLLALLNDQELRTMVIVGRPELGAPDWRNNVPGKPMSPQDVTDVVAWLAAQRPKFPGQPYSSTAKSTGEIP
jgi:cytochrome c oxidase cbb3-type subunit III